MYDTEMDGAVETNALSIIERLSGSRDADDFIPHLRVIKMASELDPKSLGLWKGISRFAGNYHAHDQDGLMRLACPTENSAYGTQYLVLKNSGSGVRTVIEKVSSYHDILDKYFTGISNSSFGRFGILKFPFKELVTKKIENEQSLRERMHEVWDYPVDIDDWRNIHDQAGFVDPARGRFVRFSGEELTSDNHFGRMWKFIEGMQQGKSWIHKTFWDEPIVVHGNREGFVVMESHHRMLAAKLLGIPMVPVYFTTR